ncbi:MAG: hypothetical protein U1F14_07425 [Steroidobacteraceae bacterium]
MLSIKRLRSGQAAPLVRQLSRWAAQSCPFSRPSSRAIERIASAAARLLAAIWVSRGQSKAAWARFSPVFVGAGLTVDFDEWTEEFPKQHLCFRVEQDAFNAILSRIQSFGIAYRSTPHGPVDYKVNPAFGGSIVYWDKPDGHVWELLTISYERQDPANAQGAA